MSTRINAHAGISAVEESNGSIRPRLRIGMLCFSGALGGMELSMHSRAAELIERGHDVVSILPDAPELHSHAAQLGIATERVVPSLPYLDPLAGRAIRSIVRRRKLDLLLVGRSRDLSTAIIGAGRHVAVVLYSQMQSGIDKHDWFHDRIYRRLDRAIAITEQSRSELARNTALPEERIDLVRYGLDASRYSFDEAARRSARARFGISDDAFVVGIIGGFNPGKGQREFLQALGIAALLEPEIGARIHAPVVGYRSSDSPEYLKELEALRDALPFADRVRFHPFQNDPRPAFAALDIFVLASHSETFGIVLQEAMASGAATIGTASGGVGEIVHDGVNGLLVPPRDPEAIAATIVRLYRDRELARKLRSNARAFVEQEYDVERQADRFEESLLAAHRHRRAGAPIH